MLHGREPERARLSALLDDARAGRAGALVLRGPAGEAARSALDVLALSRRPDRQPVAS